MDTLGRFLKSGWIIFTAALLIRLLYLLFLLRMEPVHGSQHFLYGGETGSIAASIASGHGFSSPLSAPSGPTAWMTPVFPYVLAGVFKIFGIYSIKSNLVIRSLDILFSSLTCFPILFLGRRVFGGITAAIGGWIWAFAPPAVYFPVVWVWDMSLAALALAIALWLSYEIEKRDDLRTWAFFGCIWGFAVLVNAAILSVFPGCLAFALYRRRARGSGCLGHGSLAILAFAITLSPWIIRNEIVFHGKVALRSNFGLELWLGNNPEVPDTWSWWLHPTGSRKEYDKFFRLGEVAYMQEKKSEALQFIETHPRDVLRFQFHRFLETWTGSSESFRDIWATNNLGLRAELLTNYSLTLLMLIGLLVAYRESPLLSLPLLSAIVLFPIPYYICHTTARYRHPIDPVIAILAAHAFATLARTVRLRFVSGRHQTTSTVAKVS